MALKKFISNWKIQLKILLKILVENTTENPTESFGFKSNWIFQLEISTGFPNWKIQLKSKLECSCVSNSYWNYLNCAIRIHITLTRKWNGVEKMHFQLEILVEYTTKNPTESSILKFQLEIPAGKSTRFSNWKF